MTPNMSRACDCCSRRKVRCDREQPCRNCRKSELICTYESKPKKRGPKGPTKVIQALRLLQAQQADDTLAGSSDSQHAHVLGTRGDGPTKRPSSSRRDSAHSLQYRPGSRNSSRGGIEQARAGHKPSSISSSDGSSKPNRHAFQPSLYVHNPAALKGFSNSAEVFTPHSMLTHSVVKACTDTFFENLYSIVPIFNRSTFTTRYLSSFQSRPKMYALVSSMCALTITQLCAAPISPKEEDDDASGSALGLDGGARIKLEEGEVMLSEALRARQYFDLIGGPDLDTVITTFFIFCCFRNLERHSHAWYYLRECITFAQELGLDDDRDHTLRRRRSGVHNTDSMLDSDPMDMPEYQAMAKRMYWLLFNTERLVITNPSPLPT